MKDKNPESLGSDYKDSQASARGTDAASAANSSSVVSGRTSTEGRKTATGAGSPIQPETGAGSPKVDGAQALSSAAESSRSIDQKDLSDIKPSYIGTGYTVEEQSSPSGYGGNHGTGGSTGRRAMRMGEPAGVGGRSDNAARPNLASLNGSDVDDQVSLETVVAETLLEGMMAPRTRIPTEPAPSEPEVTGTDVSTMYVLDVNDHSYDFVKGIAGTMSDNFNTSVDEVIIPGVIVHDDAPPVHDGVYEPITYPNVTLRDTGDAAQDGYFYVDTEQQVRSGEFVLKEISFGTLDGDNSSGSSHVNGYGACAIGSNTLIPIWEGAAPNVGTITRFDVGEYTQEIDNVLHVRGMIPLHVVLTYQDVTQHFEHASKADKIRFADMYRNIRYNRVNAAVMDISNRMGNNLSPEFQPFFSSIPQLVNTHQMLSTLLADQGATIYAAHKTYEPALANMMAHLGKTADADALFGYFICGGHPYSQQVLSDIGRVFRDVMSTNYRGGANAQNVQGFLRQAAANGCVTGCCTAYDSPWKGRSFLSLFEASKFNYNGAIKENLGKIGNFAISPSVKKRIDHAIEFGPMEDEATGVQPIAGCHHLSVTHNVTFGSYYTLMYRENIGNGFFQEHILMYFDPSRKRIETFPMFGYKYQYTGMSAPQQRWVDISVLRGLIKSIMIDDFGVWRNRSVASTLDPTGTQTWAAFYRKFKVAVDNNLRAPSMWHHIMCKAATSINKDFQASMYDLYKYMYCKNYLDDNAPNKETGSYDVIVRKLPYDWLTSFLDDSVIINSVDGIYSGIELSRNGRTIMVNNVKAAYTNRPRFIEDLIWFGDKYVAIQATVNSGKVTYAKYVDPELFVNSYATNELYDNDNFTIRLNSDMEIAERRHKISYPSSQKLFQNKQISILNWRNVNGRDKRRRQPPYVVHPLLVNDPGHKQLTLANPLTGNVPARVGITFSQSRNSTPGAIVNDVRTTGATLPTYSSILTAARERRTLTFDFFYGHYPHYFVIKNSTVSTTDNKRWNRYFKTANLTRMYANGAYSGGNVADTEICDVAASVDANTGCMFCPQSIQFDDALIQDENYLAVANANAVANDVVMMAYGPTYVAFRYDRPNTDAEWNDPGFLSANKSVVFSTGMRCSPNITSDANKYNFVEVAQRYVRFENWISAPLSIYSDRVRSIAAVANLVNNDQVVWKYAVLQAHEQDMNHMNRWSDYTHRFAVGNMEPIIYKLFNDETINEFDQLCSVALACNYGTYAPDGNTQLFIHPFARWMSLTAGVLPMEYDLPFNAELRDVRDKFLVLAYDPFYDFEEWTEQVKGSLSKSQ